MTTPLLFTNLGDSDGSNLQSLVISYTVMLSCSVSLIFVVLVMAILLSRDEYKFKLKYKREISQILYTDKMGKTEMFMIVLAELFKILYLVILLEMIATNDYSGAQNLIHVL